ncbi:MAG TPA: hypothetical protein VG860_18265 [Terriglobia bacterium]|nr:hypothetical protein [Terriglobia bacterium]
MRIGRHAGVLVWARGSIRDYFAAATLVVWDVDVLRAEAVKAYRAADPDNPPVEDLFR